MSDRCVCCQRSSLRRDNVSKREIDRLYDGLNPDKRKRFPGDPLLKCRPVQQAVGRGRGRPRKTGLVTTERRVVEVVFGQVEGAGEQVAGAGKGKRVRRAPSEEEESEVPRRITIRRR
jgi:hypothetical protein